MNDEEKLRFAHREKWLNVVALAEAAGHTITFRRYQTRVSVLLTTSNGTVEASGEYYDLHNVGIRLLEQYNRDPSTAYDIPF